MTALDAYIDRVTTVLADEFDWDTLTMSVFGSAFVSSSHLDHFEFICDSPISARWRVKHNRDDGHRWALRMAYYGDNPDRREREESITKRLTEALP